MTVAVFRFPHNPDFPKPDLVENPQDEDLKRGRDCFNRSITAIAFQKKKKPVTRLTETSNRISIKYIV